MRLSKSIVNGLVSAIFALFMMVPVQAKEAYALPEFTQTSAQAVVEFETTHQERLIGNK